MKTLSVKIIQENGDECVLVLSEPTDGGGQWLAYSDDYAIAVQIEPLGIIDRLANQIYETLVRRDSAARGEHSHASH